ncbi:MAG: ABC transporter permease [Thermoanaerobaculia bacterium]
MLRLMLKNLVRRPLRSLFTVAGVTVGTAAYIALVALSQGMQDQSQRVVDMLGTDITVTRAKTPIPWMSFLNRDEVAALAGLPNVTSVSGVVVGTTRAGSREMFLVFGADPRQPLIQSLKIVSGRQVRPGGTEMVVGEEAASQLDLAPGDRVELAGRVLDVVGVFVTGRGVLDASAVVDVTTAQSLFGTQDRVNLAFVNVRSGEDVARTTALIHTRFPRLEATPSALLTSRFAYIDLISAYARAFALVALVLAAVMIANTVGMNVNERRQEIALLRSIGWSRMRIMALVAGETGAMIAIGALLAVPCAALGLRLLDDGDAVWLVPASVGGANVIEGVVLAFLVGLLFALLPIADALRRRPAEALRSL